MKCLAVNTATKALSVAIVDDDRTLHLFETPEMRDQGNVLLSHIQAGLSETGLDFADLDLLSVVTGPGSFTGIRLGLAAMRGIAMAADKPLLGVSSFDMFSVRQEHAINIIAVESWREELYFAALDDEGHPVVACANETPEAFFRRCTHTFPEGAAVVVSGDAKAAVAPLFDGARLVETDANAVDVARLALRKLKKGDAFSRPVPYYLREADVTISSRVPKTLKEKDA